MSSFLHMPEGFDPLNALIFQMREELRMKQRALEALEMVAKQRDELREECARLRLVNRELETHVQEYLERQLTSPFTSDMMDALVKGVEVDALAKRVSFGNGE